jgi:hypothetical protein
MCTTVVEIRRLVQVWVESAPHRTPTTSKDSTRQPPPTRLLQRLRLTSAARWSWKCSEGRPSRYMPAIAAAQEGKVAHNSFHSRFVAMTTQVPHVPLGSCGLFSPRIALGTMGMTAFYNTDPGATEEESLRTLAAALELGVNHLDTAWVYFNQGTAHHNEELVGKALAAHGRERFTVATKFFPPIMNGGAIEANIRTQLTESLRRLGTSYVDLYYMHRVCDKVLPAALFYRLAVIIYNVGTSGRGGSDNEQVESRGSNPIRWSQRVHTLGAAALPRRLPRHLRANGIQPRLPRHRARRAAVRPHARCCSCRLFSAGARPAGGREPERPAPQRLATLCMLSPPHCSPQRVTPCCSCLGTAQII